METKDHILTGTKLARPSVPMSALGEHTDARKRAETPVNTGALANRGHGARPLGAAR